MKTPITHQIYNHHDVDSLFKLLGKLYKSMARKELFKLLQRITKSKKYLTFLAKDSNENSIAFSTFSIRTDYVEGAGRSPTGYLESIYVEPEYRNLGIAKKFIELGEQWCKEKGCEQMGSDTWLNNYEAQNFHLSMGFQEEDRLVHFIKKIE